MSASKIFKDHPRCPQGAALTHDNAVMPPGAAAVRLLRGCDLRRSVAQVGSMPRRRLLTSSSALTAPLIAAALAGCGADPATTELCVAERFEEQSTARFVAGETFYLPKIAEDKRCDAVRWTVSARPDGSEEPIIKGADGLWRLTPTTPGRWGFTLAEVEDAGADAGELSLTVVEAAARPFTNLNYYPSRSAALVGDELWVANVQTPTITRIDPSTLTVLGEHPVGSWPVAIAWREGMDFAVVAQRGSDTLALVDRASGRVLDAIWTGDEPADVVVSSDGATAYVSLKSEAAIAVIDLATRTRRARVDAVADPLALALSADDATLYVASHRSGMPSRFPYESDPIEEERDLMVIDTASLEPADVWLDVGTTITGLLLDPAGEILYVSRTRNDTEASLGDASAPNFFHEVARLDAKTGAPLAAADLGRQPGSGGAAVSLHGLALAGTTLWVAAEGSDLTVGLDPLTLAEVARVATPGRPRALVAAGDDLFTHGAQATLVTKISGAAAAGEVTTTIDRRPELVAAGQRYFTGAGRLYADTWSCNSCHADGLSDTLVWNAGPFAGRKVSRPFFWLEGTYPLGWDGYLSSVDNYAFTVNTNVGVRPTSAEHQALSAYLASLMPPPPANGLTRRDGALSEEALRGKRLFEGEAGCAACHPLPLTTSRALIPSGVTEGVTDVPGLIGSYRLGVWLKLGGARTLESAVEQVLTAFGGPALADEDSAALVRFLKELTARDLFVLAAEPRPGAASVSREAALQLTFSAPIWADPTNLARVSLLGPDGAEVAVNRVLDADGRHMSLEPVGALAPGALHTIRVDPALEGFDERTLWAADPAAPAPTELTFTTANPPSLRLAGEYVWTVDMPLANPGTGKFDRDTILPTLTPLTATETPSGAALALDYSQGLALSRLASVDGAVVVSPPLPVPIGPSFADTSGFQGALVDLDDDGVGDYAEGLLTISGPGFVEAGIAWRLSRPSADECALGPAGELPVDVALDGPTPLISWGDAQALGLYVIDPAAQPPAGPGAPVTGGATYWALQLEAFPDGFVGPVTYGEVPPAAVDITMAVGGAAPGPAALVSGQCYKVHVTTTMFSQGSFTFVMP
jgi:hypothetical protein